MINVVGPSLQKLKTNIENSSSIERQIKTEKQKMETKHISLNEIKPDENQPRNNAKIDSMAKDLEINGQYTPIKVVQEDDEYRIVSGERRYWGAKEANFSTLRAEVYNDSDEYDIKTEQVLENTKRKKLTGIEAGDGFVRSLRNMNVNKPVEDITKIISDMDNKKNKSQSFLDVAENDQKKIAKVCDSFNYSATTLTKWINLSTLPESIKSKEKESDDILSQHVLHLINKVGNEKKIECLYDICKKESASERRGIKLFSALKDRNEKFICHLANNDLKISIADIENVNKDINSKKQINRYLKYIGTKSDIQNKVDEEDSSIEKERKKKEKRINSAKNQIKKSIKKEIDKEDSPIDEETAELAGNLLDNMVALSGAKTSLEGVNSNATEGTNDNIYCPCCDHNTVGINVVGCKDCEATLSDMVKEAEKQRNRQIENTL